jgi:hypothetical protein
MWMREFDPSIEPAEFEEMLGIQLSDATDANAQWWERQIADAYTRIDDALSMVEAKYWICPADHISERVPYQLPDRVISAARLIDSIYGLGHEKKFAKLAIRHGFVSRVLGAGRFRSELTLDPVGSEIVGEASALQQRANIIIFPPDHTSELNTDPGRGAAVPSESQSSGHVTTESNADVHVDAAVSIAPEIDLQLFVWRTDRRLNSENGGEQPLALQSATQSTPQDDQLSRWITKNEAARLHAGCKKANASAYFDRLIEAGKITPPEGTKGGHLWRFYVRDFPPATRGELLGGPRHSEREV